METSAAPRDLMAQAQREHAGDEHRTHLRYRELLMEHGHLAPDVQSVQRWMTLDLFLAVVGTPDYDFDEWFDRKGFADAWAALCAKVKETFDAN